MKKTKLLMPILGTTALMGAITPIVACNTQSTKGAKIIVYNVGQAESIITTEKTRAEVGKDFVSELTWEAPEAGAYFVNAAYVVIGSTPIEEYNEQNNPNGYHLSNYAKQGVTITIPGVNIKDESEISIIIDLKQLNCDMAIKVNNYESEYISLVRGQEVQATYDVLRSSGHFETGAECDAPSAFAMVKENDTVEFAFDLTQWTEKFESTEPLYAIMGYWNKTSGNFQALYPRESSCGYVWYGENNIPLTCTAQQTLAAFEIEPPVGGWGELSQNRKSLFLNYTFQNSHNDYFQVMIGQEHKD